MYMIKYVAGCSLICQIDRYASNQQMKTWRRGALRAPLDAAALLVAEVGVVDVALERHRAPNLHQHIVLHCDAELVCLGHHTGLNYIIQQIQLQACELARFAGQLSCWQATTCSNFSFDVHAFHCEQAMRSASHPRD